MPSASGSNENNDDIVEEITSEAQNIIDKIINDVGKTSATRQFLFGGVTGWLTGYTLMKVGKAAAATIGSGILLLQVANYNGYININWDRITRKAEELADGIEDAHSTKKPNLLKKMERYVDKKLDKIEGTLEKKEVKAKKLLRRIKDDQSFVFEEVHVFSLSYFIGVAIGILSGIF